MLATNFLSVQQILVERAGHNVHLDKPEAVLAPIRAMLLRLRASVLEAILAPGSDGR